jgi:hypothetical protein
MNKLSKRIFHPLFFAIYPPLFLLSKNIDVTTPATAIRTILFSILGGVLLLLIGKLIIRDWNKAAVIATLILVLFYSYIPVFSAIEKKSILGFMIGRQRFIILAWVALLIFGLFLVFRAVKDFETVNQGLNLIGAVLIVFSLIQIGNYEFVTAHAPAQTAQELGIHSIANQLHPPQKSTEPDIYYILLDTYARDDMLLKDFGYDNSPFLDQLKAKGFYIPDCAKTNYDRTELSMSSMLNMNYLDEFAKTFLDKPGELKKDFSVYMVHNQVRSTLEDLGYKTVAFQNKYSQMSVTDAAYYFAPKLDDYSNSIGFWIGIKGVTDFEEMTIDATPLTAIKSKIMKFTESDSDTIQASVNNAIFYENYLRDKYEINTLVNDIPLIPGPKFVFAHMLTIHPSYVLDENGNFHYYTSTDPTIYNQGYIDGMKYTNKYVLELVNNILAESKNPPIILILGDHGWTQTPDRRYNLAAYYLPGEGKTKLYSSITPVNIFRIIFDQYFGGKLDLLKDINYYSTDQNLDLTLTNGDRRPECNISNP